MENLILEVCQTEQSLRLEEEIITFRDYIKLKFSNADVYAITGINRQLNTGKLSRKYNIWKLVTIFQYLWVAEKQTSNKMLCR
jgi:hypothetical protein